MPLSSKESGGELWSAIINKTTGKPYVGLERCNDIDRFSEEEGELSELLSEKMDEWKEKDPKGYGEKINQFTKDGGFQYKHSDGYTYKIVKSNDGRLNLSRSKASAWSGKGGGFSVQLRPVAIRVANMEAVSQILAEQGDTDNYRITYMSYTKEQGHTFLMEQLKPYSPRGQQQEETKKDESKGKSNGNKEEESPEEDSEEE